VRERIFVPGDVPAAVVEWTAERPVRLSVGWRADLRLMWPYPPGALGPLRWRIVDRALLIAPAHDDDRVMFMFSAPLRSLRVSDASDEAPALHATADFDLEAGESVRFAAVGASSDADLDRALRRLRRPDALVQARRAAGNRLEEDRLAVDAPDPRATTALDWAKERLASYVVDAPGVGRSLVAGYWGSRPDWFHDGRPGYAWFFGRDAVWTALACLAVGDAEAARDVLRFLGERQDLSGKVLHECTTSGVVHYDSADATPLYLLLIARYLAWTGDRSFVRGQWDRVLAAYAFCRATDTDGDGLIENTRVGHGWIEFGRLGGGTITGYNTAIWTAALHELADAAESIGENEFADALRRQHDVARTAFERVLYDESAGHYALNARRIQSSGPADRPARRSPSPRLPVSPSGGKGWERNPTQTAMQAVPLLLGVADPARATRWLDAISGDDFTAPWGVRMLPVSDPAYDPESYHGGAVWPLFTGWASWAEYAAGRPQAGFDHWWMNVEHVGWRERGAWDEVVHGLERRGRGVCPDQAWSTAMAVAPLVYGMLGVQPDACVHRLRLRPQIPASWDHLTVRRLAVGEAHVSLAYRRDGVRHTFDLSQTRGSVPLNVVFEPALPGGRPTAVLVDGAAADLEARPFGERMLVPVQLVLDAPRRVVIELGEHGGDRGPQTLQ
jgi:glycogen debranching enzyme